MSEVYKKVGRGGAGNYYSKQDIAEATKTTTDLESQTPTQTPSTVLQPSTTSPPSEYLHTGRGGAGNWIQPSTLTTSGLTQQASPDPTSTTTPSSAPAKRVIGSSKPAYRGGRGGAGNYYGEEEEMRVEEARKREEEERMKVVEREVARDVEGGLRRPERAYGGCGR